MTCHVDTLGAAVVADSKSDANAEKSRFTFIVVISQVAVKCVEGINVDNLTLTYVDLSIELNCVWSSQRTHPYCALRWQL